MKIERMALAHTKIGHETSVLNDVNLELRPGNIYWVRGETGGGKSTLLKTFAGLIPPMEGNFYINDVNINELTFEEFLPFRLRIGYSFDLGGLIYNRTLWDNILLPMLYHKTVDYNEAEARADLLFRLFGIERYRNERPAAVPGGIRKAACVLRAFVLEPQVLLLDEPLTGLNEEGIRALDALVKKFSPEQIVLVTSRAGELIKDWAHAEIVVDKNQVKLNELSRNEREAV